MIIIILNSKKNPTNVNIVVSDSYVYKLGVYLAGIHPPVGM